VRSICYVSRMVVDWEYVENQRSVRLRRPVDRRQKRGRDRKIPAAVPATPEGHRLWCGH
jgi:hypothetical protein